MNIHARFPLGLICLTSLLSQGLSRVFSSYSHQIRSVAQSCPTLCDPVNRSTPGIPVQLKLNSQVACLHKNFEKFDHWNIFIFFSMKDPGKVSLAWSTEVRRLEFKTLSAYIPYDFLVSSF